MTNYKLIYFDIMGLGEPVRFMLSYLGKEFEDIRIPNYNVFSKQYKSKMPFGKVPLLEIDGKETHQSLSICRYLGQEANLAGENRWESLQIDSIMDTFSDFRVAVWSYYYCKDEDHKSKIKDKVLNEIVPYYLEKFDEIIQENGYLANGKLSWGDIYFVAVLGYFSFIAELDICAKYPNIKALRDKIHDFPSIQKWLEKRPKTVW
ncbi:glutathione S-transferase-like [Cimex lectularius]|uniref:glutathione transferase n=1 Tax=Cimex lectularius TaxID=79782 RepID=A0A8I6RH08_CIMLE|nr:glutathione S-transferase-like [Cimex lectularius]